MAHVKPDFSMFVACETVCLYYIYRLKKTAVVMFGETNMLLVCYLNCLTNTKQLKQHNLFSRTHTHTEREREIACLNKRTVSISLCATIDAHNFGFPAGQGGEGLVNGKAH